MNWLALRAAHCTTGGPRPKADVPYHDKLEEISSELSANGT